MKSRNLIFTAVFCAAVLLAAALLTGYWEDNPDKDVLYVGFIYSEDESTPYTANFVMAQRAVEEEYGSKVKVLSRSNVPSRECEEPIRDMIRQGCRIIFFNMDSDIPLQMAKEQEFRNVQFCQVSLPTISLEGAPPNYHTFNGEIYQARYVSGVAAGMKLRELLDNGKVTANKPLVGYVGANDSTEVISGYTAFLLGVRSVVPEATMRVLYTGSWGNYHAEKKATKALIDKGCVIIAQHVNTSAPAMACQEAKNRNNELEIYHIGYHQSMIDIADGCSLLSIRTNWAPYMIQAVRAVMEGKPIEEAVEAHAHGNDMSAGFESGWVEILDLNNYIVADGTQEKVNNTIDNLKKGRVSVFKGNYTGVNPKDLSDTIDLNKGYTENQNSSNPSFGYVLRDCIVIENETMR